MQLYAYARAAVVGHPDAQAGPWLRNVYTLTSSCACGFSARGPAGPAPGHAWPKCNLD